MAKLTIIPQKFTFEKPTIKNGKGETISHGISVTIDIDAFKADKAEIKKDLATILLKSLNTLIRMTIFNKEFYIQEKRIHK